MRVLLIANTGWYLRNFRANLVKRLEANGFEVMLSSLPDADTSAAFFRERCFEPLHISRSGRNPLRELLAIVEFLRLLRRSRPSLVLTWTPKPNLYASLAGRFSRIPVIPNVSGLGFVFIRNGWFAGLMGRLYGFAFRRCPTVFFQNEEDRKSFVSAGWVNKDRGQRLPGSGVDLKYFRLRPLPPTEPFVFLFLGRFLADKGLRELVEAASELRRAGRQFVLRLAGFLDPANPTAISQAELNQWVKNGAVEHIGPLEDVRPVLEAAHCVVLPSSYREGVPRSLLEAAAMGRPIITTDASGCRDSLIPGKSGFLCTLRDAASLADCMRQALDCSFEKLTAMGRAGREHVERHFSEELVLDAYLQRCVLLRSGRAQFESREPDRRE